MTHYVLVIILTLTGCAVTSHSSQPTMESTDRVYATLVLKSPSGRSVLDTPATSANIDTLQPDTQAIELASQFLTQAGFQLEQAGVVLSFSGDRRRIETVFRISLTPYEKAGKIYYRKRGQAIVPDSLRSIIADVVLDEPRQLFSP